MRLHELSPAKGSTQKSFRVGRGIGSGNGKTSGKGHKGQNARSGGGKRPGFEGGQIPLYRRLPKRGFHNIFAKEYQIVNVNALDKFDDGDVIDAKALTEKGLIHSESGKVKILGSGDIKKKVTVRASIFSSAAKEKIEAAGGKAEVV